MQTFCVDGLKPTGPTPREGQTSAEATRAEVMPHPARLLVARYAAVLGAAWRLRADLAGPRRLTHEAAFLPAALEIQETPVHPAPRRAAWAIMFLLCSALIWSWVGQVDIVAVAPGRIVVDQRTKIVQPLEAGSIRAIHVRDGDVVSAGQLLIELDATHASADRQGVEEQLRVARSDVTRASALLTALTTGRAPQWPADEAATVQGKAQLQAEWGDITARMARLDAELARRGAERATVQEGVAKLQLTLPLARQREADFKALVEQGFVTGHAGQDRSRERMELERDLSAQRARLAETEAALLETRRARAAYLAETQRSLNDRHARAVLEVAQLQQQGAKTVHRERLAKLMSPVAGTVQQLAVHTPGGVVTPAQALMVIVPHDAEVLAEVVIANQDIGFVRPGQLAQVKVETFSFTRYGTVPAVVERVAADAVMDEKLGAVFPAMIRLDRAGLDVNGQWVRLGPGMQVTAEVGIGKRRVIDYLLSPVRQTLDEGGRER